MFLKEILAKVDWMPKSLELFVRSIKAKRVNSKFLIKDMFAGTTVILSEVRKRPKILLKKMGIKTIVGKENILDNFDDALVRANKVRVLKNA